MLHTAKIIGDIHACAEAASMSYNKDMSAMSREQIEAYVRRIWDNHTNVSEHFVVRLKFTEIPRLASLLMAFQRHITITEMSQRRCKPSVTTEEYDRRLTGGDSLEDARKCLPVDTPSNLTVTMNREAAKNVARIFQKYEKYDQFKSIVTLEMPKILGEHFLFEPDDQEPYKCPGFNGVHPVFQVFTRKINETGRLFVVPMYSFHQLCRHRDNKLVSWYVASPELRNDTLVSVVCESLEWDHFAQVRSGADTQEPLRSMALQIKEEMKL